MDVIDLTSSSARNKSKSAIKCNNDSTRHGRFSRQFWSAGEGDFANFTMPIQGGMDHVRVHPKFLHSNATSHKWALGAIAELLDNAVDESENGATFVKVDKGDNPRDGSPSLVFTDNGGGMAPEKLRQCMSFGYSQKSATSIGQYGNGFKTSTMRLGSDVVVFSRTLCNGVSTQSIGLLSYTYLWKTGLGDIVVPMIDYECHYGPKRIVRTSMEDWENNLRAILEWSPYDTESELLEQCESLGSHGTKVMIYNLWLNDDGVLELDFDSDSKDIQLRGGGIKSLGVKDLYQKHIAHRLRYSLQAYASILYLQMPHKFKIILRGHTVVHYFIAKDLKFPEHVQYKPQIGGASSKEVSAITTIGFTKEAPLLNVHGFNVYHKNRLIMPFWKVLTDNSSRGRGVIGVLEANFIEPAHDKQDFEKTALLVRLESRLKQMTLEYWNLHCDKIGYQSEIQKRMKRLPSCAPAVSPATTAAPAATSVPVAPPLQACTRVAEAPEAYGDESIVEVESSQRKKRKAEYDSQDSRDYNQAADSEFKHVVEENTRLQLRCAELELNETESQKKRKELELQKEEHSQLAVEYEKKHLENEQRCKELQTKVLRYEREFQKMEREKTEYQVKLDVAETELLEIKNKYIKLLMSLNMKQMKTETDN